MSKLYHSLEELVGNTPLLELVNIEKKYQLKAKIYAKLEYLNPWGSIKDRIIAPMIKDLEDRKLINKDTIIVVATSGNTGIALAGYLNQIGYQAIIFVPDNTSRKRINLLIAYGVKVIITQGINQAIEKAIKLSQQLKNSYYLDQFQLATNPLTHYLTTGKEIYDDTLGKIDYLVSGIGTGGTISGVGKYLKEKNPQIKIIGVEPLQSPLLSLGIKGNHQIQGIGAGFIPSTLDLTVIDQIMTVDQELIKDNILELVTTTGLLVGLSSAAVFLVAKELALNDQNEGKVIVVIFPDSGERYLDDLGVSDNEIS